MLSEGALFRPSEPGRLCSWTITWVFVSIPSQFFFILPKQSAGDYAVDAAYLLSVFLLLWFALSQLRTYIRNGATLVSFFCIVIEPSNAQVYIKDAWHWLDWILIGISILQVLWYALGILPIWASIKDGLSSPSEITYDSIAVRNIIKIANT